MTSSLNPLAEDLGVIRSGCGADTSTTDVVRVTGEDAAVFLQGQLSQDVEGLEVGGQRWALLLEPAGRVIALLRVWRCAEDQFLLECGAGFGEPVRARLDRFRLRVRVELDVAALALVRLRGPATPERIDPPEGTMWSAVELAGLRGLDLLGPDAAIPAGVQAVSAQAIDSVRIEAGWPAMGTEFDPTPEPLVIPAEAGGLVIDESVSFTKGCYVGQELVARVDSRGSNTPRKLRGVVVLDSGPAPEAGDELFAEGERKGALTSVGWSADSGAAIALAYVHRSIEPGDRLVLRGAEGERSVEVRDLPLVGAP
jgi:tRNA-modifying protein YgfZ